MMATRRRRTTPEVNPACLTAEGIPEEGGREGGKDGETFAQT